MLAAESGDVPVRREKKKEEGGGVATAQWCFSSIMVCDSAGHDGHWLQKGDTIFNWWQTPFLLPLPKRTSASKRGYCNGYAVLEQNADADSLPDELDEHMIEFDVAVGCVGLLNEIVRFYSIAETT